MNGFLTAEQSEAMGGMVGADDVARWGGLGRAVSRCGTARETAGEDRGGGDVGPVVWNEPG